MKAQQNFRISLSDLPLGSKSAPPLPPPMFTALYQPWFVGENYVKCTASQGILEDLLEAQKLEN